MNSQNQLIPYSNLGKIDIYQLKLKLLGFLKAYLILLSNKGLVYLNLPDLFDRKLLQNNKPNNIKDLFYLAYYSIDKLVKQADISTH